MNIEEILKYVNHTPQNTNLSILKQMIDPKEQNSKETRMILDHVERNKYSMNISILRTVLDTVGGSSGIMPAGLYEPGAIALYQAGDVEAASVMLKTSWDDLVANGVIAVSEGAKLPEGAELNEYGFYYGVKYSASMNGMTASFIFNEDGSAVFSGGGEVMDIPAGAIIYGDHVIDMSALDFPVCIVSDDGASIDAQGLVFYVSEDPKLPEGAELNEYGFCYGIAYSVSVEGMTVTFVFNEDGSAVFSGFGEVADIPAGTIIYGDHVIDMSALDFPIGTVSEDGLSIDCGEGMVFTAGTVNNRPKGMVYLPATSVIEGDLVIINDGSATCFEPYTFKNKIGVTGIVIPDSISSIGVEEFRGCSNMINIVIGNGVTSIGEYAFFDCASLVSIVIPDSVTSIGRWALEGCTSLTKLTIGNGVTSIGSSAFCNCSNLTDITIGNGVTSIVWGAFRGCTSLVNITIPDNVTSIGGSAFEECTSLTSVVIPDGVTSIDAYAFAFCTNLKSITFAGTTTQWNAIEKDSDWNYNVPATYVQCSDGQVSLV